MPFRLSFLWSRKVFQISLLVFSPCLSTSGKVERQSDITLCLSTSVFRDHARIFGRALWARRASRSFAPRILPAGCAEVPPSAPASRPETMLASQAYFFTWNDGWQDQPPQRPKKWPPRVPTSNTGTREPTTRILHNRKSSLTKYTILIKTA